MRPVDILPRLSGVEIRDEDRELTLVLAENLFPGVTHIDQLDDGAKAWWILVAGRLLSGDKAVARYVEAFSRVFLPSVDAQVDDVFKRQEFDFADKGRRAAAEELERRNREARETETHQANLARIAKQGTEDDERWHLEQKERTTRLELEDNRFALEEKRFVLEEKERTTKLQNRSWRERLGISMALLGFLAAFALLFIGVASGEKVIAGSSGTVAAAILAVVIRLLFLEQKQPPPSPPSEPPAGA